MSLVEFDPIIILIVGLAGLMLGSLLNVLIVRYQTLESVINGRSKCTHCEQTIAWYDLVPIISFVVLGAKCRYCREKISWRYPIIELLTALMLMQLFLLYGFTLIFIIYSLIFSLLIVISAIDLTDGVIPDIYMLPAIMLALLAYFINPNSLGFESVWGVLIAGGSLAAIVLLSRERWMGSGDIGLGILLGLMAGLTGSVVGLVLAFVGGSVISLLAILFKQKSLKQTIAFGPFLAVATYISAHWGNQLANWYLTLVHYI